MAITDYAPIVPTEDQRNALRSAAAVLRECQEIADAAAAAERIMFMSMNPVWQHTATMQTVEVLREYRRTLLHQANADFWVSQNLLPGGEIDVAYLEIASEIAQDRARQAQILSETLNAVNFVSSPALV